MEGKIVDLFGRNLGRQNLKDLPRPATYEIHRIENDDFLRSPLLHQQIVKQVFTDTGSGVNRLDIGREIIVLL